MVADEPKRSVQRNVPIRSVVVNTYLVHHSGMKQTDPQYKLRIPQELKDKIEEAAEANGRSMNAEIVQRLQDSFSDHQTARLLHERRKLELVASYVEWCDKKGLPTEKSFIAYASAYKEAMDASLDLIGNPEMQMVSGVLSVDANYLSELYANWVIERPGRFPELADKEKIIKVTIRADKSVTVQDIKNSLRKIDPITNSSQAMSLRLVVDPDKTE